MTNFRVGQRVVCINSKNISPHHVWLADIPAEGEIYTITGFIMSDDVARITLREISNGPGHDDGYKISHFRPLVEKKTDISIFKEILAGNRQPEGVEA